MTLGPRFPSSFLDRRTDRSASRRVAYVILALGLVALAVIARQIDTLSGPTLHLVFETVATVLACFAGLLALVRYYSRKGTTYLFIGTGFLGTALLDSYHAVVSYPFLAAAAGEDLPHLMAWTWTASRVFLSLFLFVGWWAWRREARSSEAPWSPEGSVYLAAAVLTVVSFVFFGWNPIRAAYSPGWFLSRPAEVIPGTFFLLALVGYFRKGDWRSDTFEHWLVVALILSVATHLGFLVFSEQQFDTLADAAHLLKILSYGAVLIGLMASVYVTFRREDEVARAVLEANAALAQEIGIRREAERVLQESEERLQDFLDHATDLIQSSAPDGTILYVNEAWKRTLGLRDEDLRGKTIADFVAPESRDSFREQVAKVFAGEIITDMRVVFLASDGSRVICSGSSNCRFENGRPTATRSVFRNVTEELRAEEELAQSRANLRALFESTGDAIWSVAPDHSLITFNTAYALTVEAITGRAPEVGDPLSRVVSTGDVDWFRGCFERALSGNRFSAVRDEHVDGQLRNYELFFNPIDAGTRSAGVVVFSKDITRRRRVEEALRRAKQDAEEGNRAKSQFMANMSHELRTPLNSVIGFANILLKDPRERLEPKERGYLERILANGKHLLTLINEILDLSKIEAGRMELEMESVDLPRLVRETLAQMEGQVAGRPVELHGEWNEGLASFQTDAGKLKQILINLIGNALKFTERGKVSIRIISGADGSTPTRIQVEDTGIGIPEDRLDAIFEAFQQADGTTTRRFGGTGLGLTISRSLCALLGYEMTVDSEVGKGSTFSILLSPPRVMVDEGRIRDLEFPPTARWASNPTIRQRELRGKKILVVDDEEDSRTLLSHYLGDLGCHVVTAQDGVEGLVTARRELPDLITVDLMMPRMSGWEMLKAAKDDPRIRDIPVVVVSIVAEDGAGQIFGAVDVLPKPVDRTEMIRVLRRNLASDSGRVLVVDDNADTRHILQRYLREAGLMAHAVENGVEALEYLRRVDVDLVILDLMMPEMDGFSTLSHLRKLPRKEGTPVVVLTARDLSGEERELLAGQTSGIIQKGGDVEDRLRSTLDLLFGTRGERR